MDPAAESSAKPHHGLVPASLCLAAMAVVLPFAAQFYFSVRSDRAAAEREQQVVQNGLDGRVAEISQLLAPQVVWDAAVANLDVRFNVAWAAENIGAFLHNTGGFETAYVLDRNDRMIFASVGGRPAPHEEVSALATAATTLVAQVRRREESRGSLAKAVREGRTLSDPVLAHSVALLAGRPTIIAAALVQPDFGAAMPRTDRSAIVVASKGIDPAFLQTMRRRFLLDGLKLDIGAPPMNAGQDRAVMRDASGAAVASLVWTPPAPGTAMLRNSIAPMSLIITILMALGVSLALRSRRAAKQLIASERRSNHLAYHDVLTGLPNRAMLNDRLLGAIEMLRRARRPFAVHCLDLDRFKEVNDSFGHEAGDELIRAVGKILKDTCRPFDTVARLGGDEFAIVQLEADVDAAGALASRIVNALSQPVDLAVGRVHVGCSIGVTLVTEAVVSPQEALRQADLALYRAKDEGRGRFSFFETELDVAQKMRRALKEDLRQALAERSLDVEYQPQVSAGGEVSGFEALARWTHPERGVVAPSVFVPLAEESGLIESLGAYVMRRAFEDSRHWAGLRTAINISASQLRRKGFVQRISALVEETGVSPADFELEITEGVLLGDDPLTLETLTALRKLGFAIALDDFGTGYSSLSYLQRYPIDRIKIDRSFITNLGVEAEAGDVVSAIVRLARALGLSVIAEGVETERQRLHLITVGCRDMQGFLFGRPMSLEEASAAGAADVRSADAPAAEASCRRQ